MQQSPPTPTQPPSGNGGSGSDPGRLLAEIARELLSRLDTRAVLDWLCERTAEVLSCESVQLRLWQPADDSLLLAAGSGKEADEESQVQRLPRGMVSRLLQALETERTVTASAEHPGELGDGGRIHAALRDGSRVVGILSVGGFAEEVEIGPEQEQLAAGIAELAEVALRQARSFYHLEQANELKLQFLAAMSHELRTPLHVIIGYNDLLTEGAFGNLSPEQTETIESVSDRAREVLALTEAILNVSQLDVGEVGLRIEPFDVVEAAREVVEELRPRCPADVELRLYSGDDIPPLNSDRERVATVLRHLLDNALRFTSEGEVLIGIENWAGGVEIRVSDTGIGIPPENRLSIFDPFWHDERLDQSEHGVGLGLYLTKRILDALGGSITVSSEVGHGSTFRIWLPSETV